MVIQQVLTDEPKNPRSLNNGIPHDLENNLLESSRQSAGPTLSILCASWRTTRRWLRDEPIQARRIGALGRGYRWVRRNPSLASMSRGCGSAPDSRGRGGDCRHDLGRSGSPPDA